MLLSFFTWFVFCFWWRWSYNTRGRAGPQPDSDPGHCSYIACAVTIQLPGTFNNRNHLACCSCVQFYIPVLFQQYKIMTFCPTASVVRAFPQKWIHPTKTGWMMSFWVSPLQGLIVAFDSTDHIIPMHRPKQKWLWFCFVLFVCVQYQSFTLVLLISSFASLSSISRRLP